MVRDIGRKWTCCNIIVLYLANRHERPLTKQVPEGTSDYQAAWIIDSADEVGCECVMTIYIQIEDAVY